MAKPVDVGGKGKGKAKGKVRVPLCVVNETMDGYDLKLVPSPSVNGRIAEEGAVYPDENMMCPPFVVMPDDETDLEDVE
jgi:hypothetical protein